MMTAKRNRRHRPGGSLTIIFDWNRSASFFARGDVRTDPHDWIADALNALETNLVRFHGGRVAVIHHALCLPFAEVGTQRAEASIAGCLEVTWSICSQTAVRDAQARRDVFTNFGSFRIVEAWHPTFTVTPVIACDADGNARTILHRVEIRPVSPVIRSIAFGVSRLDPVRPPNFMLEVVWQRDEPMFPNIMTVLRLLRGDTEHVRKFAKRLQEHQRYPFSNDAAIDGIGDVAYRMADDLDAKPVWQLA